MGFNQPKYDFALLQSPGEDMLVYTDGSAGAARRLRTAACMYGTRFGAWLSVNKVAPNAFRVTRLESPARKGGKQAFARIGAIAAEVMRHTERVDRDRLDRLEKAVPALVETVRRLKSRVDALEAEGREELIFEPER